jgi:hypothetical protein
MLAVVMCGALFLATSLGTIGVAAATKSKTTKIKHVGTVDGMPGHG